MPELEEADETPIEQQLEVIEEQREMIRDQYDSGAISEMEYKREDSILRFQSAQITEANAKEQGREAGREPDFFGD